MTGGGETARDILLITLGFPPARGGIQSCLYERARCHAERMVVLAPDHPQARHFDPAQPFPIYRWPALLGQTPGIKRACQFLFSLVMAWHLCRRYPIRAIECGQALPFAIGALFLKKIYGLPYRVWAFGDDVIKPARWPWTRGLLLASLRSAETVMAISAFSRQLLVALGLPENRLQVIYPLVDLNRFHPQSDSEATHLAHGKRDGPILLSVARLVPRKGIDVVLRLMPALRERCPGLRYWIVGEGPARRKLEELAAGLGVSEHVCFLGDIPSNELPAYYAACDVFVLFPTPNEQRGEAEGFGIAYLEAAACGRPTVAWHTGGVSEAVLHGQTGLLVPQGDTDAALQAIFHLLADPLWAEELGRRGRAWAEQRAKRSLADLRALYEDHETQTRICSADGSVRKTCHATVERHWLP